MLGPASKSAHQRISYLQLLHSVQPMDSSLSIARGTIFALLFVVNISVMHAHSLLLSLPFHITILSSSSDSRTANRQFSGDSSGRPACPLPPPPPGPNCGGCGAGSDVEES